MNYTDKVVCRISIKTHFKSYQLYHEHYPYLNLCPCFTCQVGPLLLIKGVAICKFISNIFILLMFCILMNRVRRSTKG